MHMILKLFCILMPKIMKIIPCKMKLESAKFGFFMGGGQCTIQCSNRRKVVALLAMLILVIMCMCCIFVSLSAVSVAGLSLL